MVGPTKLLFGQPDIFLSEKGIFINKLLNFVIIVSFQKIGNGKVVKILIPEKMIRDLLELHNFVKFSMKEYEKKFGKNKVC